MKHLLNGGGTKSTLKNAPLFEGALNLIIPAKFYLDNTDSEQE